MRLGCLLLLTAWVSAVWGAPLRLDRETAFLGMCDASCGVAVSTNLFLAASDEDNVLRLYDRQRPGLPLKTFDLNGFLQIKGKGKEADLEGAARLGENVYWIGSLGRNRDGKDRPNRNRFFATTVTFSQGEAQVKPVGLAYQHLLEDLLAAPELAAFNLAAAAQISPKEPGALNIEGLAATPGGQLLLGFRNPVPQGKALVVPLVNPARVIEGDHAKFSPPLLLDLGGLSIRDFVEEGGEYLIVAGSFEGGGKFQIYGWGGPGAVPAPLEAAGLGKYHPEAIIHLPHTGSREFLVFSDDGNRLIDDCRCKDLTNPDRRIFRTFCLSR